MQGIPNIPKEKLRFAQLGKQIRDEKLSVKSIGYFQDAWIRFKRNRASLAALIIIICIVLFAVVMPFFSHYEMSDADGIYAKRRPKSELLSQIGLWDGSYSKVLNDKYYFFLAGIGQAAADPDGLGATWEEGMASEFNPVVSVGAVYMAGGKEYRNCAVDSYDEIGFQYLNLTMAKYQELLAWQEETGVRVVYPMVDLTSPWIDSYNAADANYWYRHAANGTPLDENGGKMKMADVEARGLVDNYKRDAEGNIQYYIAKDKNMIQIRVLYYNYYQYINGHEPIHLLGTDAQGYDILVRLAYGIRLSLILAFSVSIINLTIGAGFGAVEGFFGGWVDLILERVSDILSGIPFVVVATLFQLHLVNTGKVSTLVGLLFAFVLTGWLSTAYLVRTQFYRFKNQEYVLSARTLGASKARLMFKHIFPNALGTIITSSVLVIPGVIFTESILSYLGIANFNSGSMTSLGTMLSNGQAYLSTDPHIILFPSLVISLLMISFNLFGNGLRDAFNPSLRGAEE